MKMKMKKKWYLYIGYSQKYGFSPKSCEYNFDYCTKEEAIDYAYDLAIDFVIDQDIVTKEDGMENWEYDELISEQCCIKVYEIEGEPEYYMIEDRIKELGLLNFIAKHCFDVK